jgi:hypothetical protein
MSDERIAFVVLVCRDWDAPGEVDSVFVDEAAAEEYCAVQQAAAYARARASGDVADSWWVDKGPLREGRG